MAPQSVPPLVQLAAEAGAQALLRPAPVAGWCVGAAGPAPQQTAGELLTAQLPGLPAPFRAQLLQEALRLQLLTGQQLEVLMGDAPGDVLACLQGSSLGLAGCSLVDGPALAGVLCGRGPGADGGLPGPAPGALMLGVDLSRVTGLADADLAAAAAACGALTRLRLAHCARLTDASVAAVAGSLPRLQQLDLAGCWRVADVSPLVVLSQLRSLDLAGLWQLPSSAGGLLWGWTQLTHLGLRGCSAVDFLSGLPLHDPGDEGGAAAGAEAQPVNLGSPQRCWRPHLLRPHPSLASLDVRGTAVACITHLAAWLPALQALHVGGAPASPTNSLSANVGGGEQQGGLEGGEAGWGAAPGDGGGWEGDGGGGVEVAGPPPCTRGGEVLCPDEVAAFLTLKGRLAAAQALAAAGHQAAQQGREAGGAAGGGRGGGCGGTPITPVARLAALTMSGLGPPQPPLTGGIMHVEHYCCRMAAACYLQGCGRDASLWAEMDRMGLLPEPPTDSPGTKDAADVVAALGGSAGALTSLDLGGSAGITDGVLEAVASSCSGLRSLNIAGAAVSNAGLAALSRLRALTCLDLGGVRPRDGQPGRAPLAGFQRQGPRVQEDQGEGGPGAAAGELGAGGGGAEPAGNPGGPRRRPSSAGMDLTPGVAAALAAGSAPASRAPAASAGSATPIDASSSRGGLVSVGLAGLGVADAALGPLAGLTRLDASRCRRLTDTALLQAVRTCPDLAALHLRGCNGLTPAALGVSAGGGTQGSAPAPSPAAAPAAGSAPGQPPAKRRAVGTSSSHAPYPALRISVSTSSLQDLPGAGGRGDGSLAAATGTPQPAGGSAWRLAQLRTFIMGRGMACDQLLAGLVGGAGPQPGAPLPRWSALRHLDAKAAASLTDGGVAHLAAAAPQLHTLLLQRAERLTDASAAALAAGCPLLRRLALAGSRVGDAGLAALGSLSALQHLDLSGTARPTSAGMAALLLKPPRDAAGPDVRAQAAAAATAALARAQQTLAEVSACLPWNAPPPGPQLLPAGHTVQAGGAPAGWLMAAAAAWRPDPAVARLDAALRSHLADLLAPGPPQPAVPEQQDPREVQAPPLRRHPLCVLRVDGCAWFGDAAAALLAAACPDLATLAARGCPGAGPSGLLLLSALCGDLRCLALGGTGITRVALAPALRRDPASGGCVGPGRGRAGRDTLPALRQLQLPLAANRPDNTGIQTGGQAGGLRNLSGLFSAVEFV